MLKQFFGSRLWANTLVLILVLAVALLAGACAEEEKDIEQNGSDVVSRDPRMPILIHAGEPIVIGVSAALTGPVGSRGMERRDAAVVGIERWKEANGDQIGGHDIMVYAEDDGCSEADVAAFAAKRLLSKQGLVGVIGPQCSGGSLAAIPVYAGNWTVMISGTATRTDLTTTQPEPKFFFRTAYTNAAQGVLQARYVISQLNAATAWVIDDSEPYGEDLANVAQRLLKESGRQVTRESIRIGAVDFSELTARIAAANPDVVIFEGFNPEGALLCRQLRDAGYDGPFVSGDAVASTTNFIEPLREQAEGAVFTGGMPTLPEEFLADYVEIVGHEPDTAFAAHVSDAAYILLDAVAQVAEEQQDGSLVIDPLELREAVSNPRLLVGVSGVIAFDENGDRVGNAETIGLYMVEVKNGEFVLLSP
jgi:branched-chain amino acid transport system substrate-binding protein